MTTNKELNDILQEVSKELDIPVEVINEAYLASWRFMRSKISELPLREDLTEEQFAALRTNFNVPFLGKLCVTNKRYLGVRKRFKLLLKIKERNEGLEFKKD